MPSIRKKRRRARRWPWLLLIVLAAGAWLYTQRNAGGWEQARWQQAKSWLHPSRAVSAPASASAKASVPAAPPCGAPLPALTGGAMAAAKTAKFTTVEYLLGLNPAAASVTTPPGVYRIQARLRQYDLGPDREYRLQLASLVNADLELNAVIPAPACASSQDDGALYDELREDVNLRFGPARPQPIALRLPADVMITGVAHFILGRIELDPVLDFRVQ